MSLINLQQKQAEETIITNMKYLSGLSCVYSVIELFVSTFLLAYFFKISNENVMVVAHYNIAFYGSVIVFAWLTGSWLKTHSKMFLYRIGCFSTFIFFLLIWYFQEKSANYVGWLGVVYGVNNSFRYFARNLLVAENVAENKMIKFQGYLEAGCSILKIVSPIVLGFFLTVDSLNNVMAVLSVLVVVDLIFSFKIKEQLPKRKLKFNIFGYIQKTFSRKEVRYLYYMEIFRGLTLSGALNVVATLYMVYLFQTNFNLGSLTSFFALASIGMNIIFGRYSKYQHFAKIISVASLVSVAASLGFVCSPSKETFILYNLCYVTAARLLLIISNVNMFNVANSLKVKAVFQTEYFAVREMFLNIGRVIGFLILFGIGFFNNFELLRYFLLLLTVGMGIMGYCSGLINKTVLKRGV